MRWEVVGWGALALVLFAAEALAPGAFMLWIGIGAAAVFALVAVFADIPLLWQVVAFVLLSVVSIQCYRRWGRSHARQSDAPLLNRRAEQLIGRVVVIDQDIVAGKGRAKIVDAVWVVAGPDLPAGSRVRVVAVEGMTLKVQQV
ncbi:MAG: NfeD family protein [Stenotrophomonas sp.]